MLKPAGALVLSLAGLLLPGSAVQSSVVADPALPFGDDVAAPPAPPVTSYTAPPASPPAPKPKPPTVQEALGKGVLVVVSLGSQRLFVFKDGYPWGSAPVSTGRHGHDTPVGVFPILQKSVAHRSTLYNDAPMPYMQRLTWGGVAMHAGALPGYRASHGCIRLPWGFAKKLYGVTSYRTTAVLITRQSAHGAGQALALAGGAPSVPRAANRPIELAETPAVRALPATAGAQTIQLAASPSAEGAATVWQELIERRPELAGLQHAVIPATVNGRQVYRLRASGPDAHAVCSRLAANGGACFNVRA